MTTRWTTLWFVWVFFFLTRIISIIIITTTTTTTSTSMVEGAKTPPNNNNNNNNKRSIISSLTKIVQTSVEASANVAQSALTNTGKAAFHLVTPKHVNKNEIFGLWRLDQVILTQSHTISCVANIQFSKQGDAITLFNHTEYKYPYFFKQRKWPRSCYIEFQARAFQYTQDQRTVVNYYYKGYFKRKILDSNVIKIVGKIYQVEQVPKLSRFFSSSSSSSSYHHHRPGIEIGSFVARKRLSRPLLQLRLQQQKEEQDYDDDNEEGEENDDEYDDDDEYEGEDEYDDDNDDDNDTDDDEYDDDEEE